MDIEITCPFGAECETIRDNKIHRCAWYIEMEGDNPQTGERMKESRCAITWLPLVLVDQTRTLNSGVKATESMRNEIIKRMDNPPISQLKALEG